MIYYNSNIINDWNFGDSNIVKVYKHGAVVFYKFDGESQEFKVCYAVVDDITQYSDREFDDVYDKATDKWFKLNNLNQYEEYGIYGSGRTITTYEGKLTIDGDYEYIYSGGSWVNVGEVSGSTIDTVWIDPPSTKNQNASFAVGHYWGEGYKMIMNAYLSGSYSGDYGSFWQANGHTPIELSFYSNGFYYDFHNPTSTTSPSVNTGDYSWRIMKNGTLRNYESGQVMLITLTNGTVRVELEDGTAIVTGSTSVSTQSWYNGLYQASLGSMNNQSKCHLSHIQVYNANDELVNDIKFVKNQGVTGSQEISAYDSVLNVTYNNTNSYTPSYHIVSESGGTEYPMYYPVIQDPPNNLVFSSMAEAEAYECPWVGMHATINGDKYVFSGDSQSGYEWVYNPSRLPVGYTEVEYITSENISTSVSGPYIDTNFTPNQNTRVVMDYQPMINGQENRRIFGSGEYNTLGYVYNMEGSVGQSNCYYYYKFGNTSSWYTTTIHPDLNRHTVDFNNNGQILLDNTSIATLPNNTFTCTYHLGLFRSIFNQYTTNNICFLGRVYSCQVYDNGTLVRDFVPCINPSNSVGMYDIVNDVFYTTANASYQFTAGNPV